MAKQTQLDKCLMISLEAPFQIPGLDFTAVWQIHLGLNEEQEIIMDVDLADYSNLKLHGLEVDSSYKAFTTMKGHFSSMGIDIQKLMDEQTDAFEETEITKEKFSWAFDLLKTKHYFYWGQNVISEQNDNIGHIDLRKTTATDDTHLSHVITNFKETLELIRKLESMPSTACERKLQEYLTLFPNYAVELKIFYQDNKDK